MEKELFFLGLSLKEDSLLIEGGASGYTLWFL